MLEHEGRITIIKKVRGRTAGMLRHLRADPAVGDAASRDSTIESRRPVRT